MENGGLTTHEVVGELTYGEPAPENSIYNVASITKSVFCLIALKLIDEGLLQLDEPIHPYWIDPDFQDDTRHKLLTPRILMSHQTGFSNWLWNNPDRKLSFNFDPGARKYLGLSMLVGVI